MANLRWFTPTKILVMMFFVLIILPSIFLGKMWGQYETLTENPDMFGLIGYTFDLIDPLVLFIVVGGSLLMLLFIFKINKGRIN